MTIARTFGAFVLTITLAAGLVSPVNASIIWYNSESAAGEFSHLYTLDTATRQIVDRGTIDGLYNLTDIAIDDNGVIYGVGWKNRNATGNSQLVQITPGSASLAGSYQQLDIKSNKLMNTVNALTWRDGMLYAASTNGQLQTLQFDGNRWQVDNLGTLNDSSAGDLAFGANGTLYAALTGGRLARINLDPSYKDFGRAIVIGNTGYSEVYGLAIGSDGTLYGTTNNSTNYGASYLVKLDPRTGASSDPIDLGTGVWGAAGGYAPVPEPSCVALVGLGGALVCLRRRRLQRRLANQ